MTIEITDRADFADKFAALMAANVSLITSGITPSRDLSSQMIDEFLDQFIMTVPAPAIPKSAGWIVTVLPSGDIPHDFKGSTFETYDDAHIAVRDFLSDKGYGRSKDYSIVKAHYYA